MRFLARFDHKLEFSCRAKEDLLEMVRCVGFAVINEGQLAKRK